MDEVDGRLGARVRRRRRLLGLTQAELGAMCGVRFQQIQKYESAANRMSAVMLWRIARAMGVEVSYFFQGLDGRPVAAGPAVVKVGESVRNFDR